MQTKQDSVMKRVREAREYFDKLCKGDPHKLGEMTRKLEKKYKGRIVYPEDLTRYRTA